LFFLTINYVTSLIANFSHTPTAVKVVKAPFLNTVACLWKNNENLTFFDATKVALPIRLSFVWIWIVLLLFFVTEANTSFRTPPTSCVGLERDSFLFSNFCSHFFGQEPFFRFFGLFFFPTGKFDSYSLLFSFLHVWSAN